MARRPARQDQARERSTGSAMRCARRSNWRRSTIRASRTAMHGKSDLPDCRTHRRRATWSCPTRRFTRFVAAAYRHDPALGLLVETLAETGARPSQAARLRVEDLHDHPSRPKVMMPKSGKGGGRNRSEKKSRTLQRADHGRAVEEVEGGGGRARRRRAAAGASRWHIMGRRPERELSPPRARDFHRHRREPRRGDVVRAEAHATSCGCCCETFRSG